ncbi:shikimate dehydrogenase (NADP(+)) [Rubrobacter xylanophilus]|uniref:Shikimate dehydrogenase (NADP(+)) n=1 Tax=Rubrobacter xylanophilus TaxID=49319 RepID=A0A510HFT4_9ACTN|nr:shikimate dehydrogenase [Rubrobacter xylanophilus]BBL78821.1 shikimate dehydrogenase (NADP(+)) [Rubrobacter xylanophilus]
MLVPRIDGETTLVGLVGHPVSHSLSPRMHNASFAALGLNYVYVPLDVRPEGLEAAVRGLGALGFRGFNVTMPHKEGVCALVDRLDEAARVSGAVNTVVLEEDGVLLGMNTDGSGFLLACRESGIDPAGKVVLVAGAGGAAAAVAVALLREGVAGLRIANRSPERAERLRERLGEKGRRVEVFPLSRVEEAAEGAHILVNATYLGMHEGDPLPFPEGMLREGVVVFDAVYRPGRGTALVRAARERGLVAVSGELMLLYQGVEAQRVWTGVDPDVGAMRRALSGGG